MSRCRIRRRMRNCRRRLRSLLWAVKPAAMRASGKPHRVVARRSFGLRVAGPRIGIELWQSGGRSQGFPRCNRLLERALLYPVSGLGFPRSREKGPSASQHWGPFFASGGPAPPQYFGSNVVM
jgi:hypothetical protein